MLENELMLNWIGAGYEYGSVLDFFSFSVKKIELIFFIYPSTSPDEDDLFFIKKADKKNTTNIEAPIWQPVKDIYLISTDESFRKKFKRSYNILKIVTFEDKVLTIGSYCDNEFVPDIKNSHIVCTIDFINLLAEATRITEPEQLNDTPFESLKCIISKKELAKELLK